eukprot:scaffold123693_cov31-Attheya_sp.AAC.2
MTWRMQRHAGCLLETLPLLQQDDYARDFRTGWTAVEHGIVDANNETRRKFWKDWCSYVKPFNTSPYLDDSKTDTHLILVGFTERVRQGNYGRGKAVRVQQVTVALRAIGKTNELAGKPNPVYRAEQKYLLPIERPTTRPRISCPCRSTKLALQTGHVIRCIAQEPGSRFTSDSWFIFSLLSRRIYEYATEPVTHRDMNKTVQCGGRWFWGKWQRVTTTIRPSNVTTCR